MGKRTDRDDAPMPATIGSSVIPIIHKLQDILAPLGQEVETISLPQVAVVGSQSSGKSSVLEALVARDFLPRGCDICTRRPLCLMLEHRDAATDGGATEWGEFRHLPGKRFHDFSEIRQEIQAETEREAGKNKGVSEKQIRLKITSPNVLNMTLIDLPGITKVPVGDQPSDIEARIRRMIMSYISQENCIILAVSPANSDLATSDALKMAREADPAGSRTIGVLTKLDIMDRGTNACNFLLGKVVPLHLGYIGVVNRSQEDINHNRSIQEALAREERFFHDNPVYKSLSDCCGIPMLAKKLNQILEEHIKMVLPKLKGELNSCMVALRKELWAYGEAVDSEAQKGVVLFNLLRRYSEAFNDMVDGKSQEACTNELFGGARIFYIFQSIFVKRLEEMDPCEDLSDTDIRMAIQNASGPFGSLFVLEVPFQMLVRKQIACLLDPSLQCLRFVHDEMIKMSRACGAIELQRFPYLRKCLDEVIGNFFREGVRPAESIITTIIEIEKNCINVWNPKFVGGKQAIELAKQQLRSSQDVAESEKLSSSEKGQKSQAAHSRLVANGASSNQEHHPQPNSERDVSSGSFTFSKTLGLSSLFGNRASSVGNSVSKIVENSSSTVQLREPPSILRPHETTEDEAIQILVTKFLLRSYYDIVRKHIQDQVPKIIMYFLVDQMKRDFHHVLIQKLYREDRFAELLQERDDIVVKRKNAQELFNSLEKAVRTLNELQSVVLWQNSSSYADTEEFPEIRHLSIKFPSKTRSSYTSFSKLQRP